MFPRSDLRDEPFARMGYVLDQVRQQSDQPVERLTCSARLPVEYYPEEEPFQRVLKLATECWLDRENAHHQKARCEHAIRRLLVGLGQCLASAGMVPRPEAVFETPLDDLLTLYRTARPKEPTS